jgi:hypothetical protein
MATIALKDGDFGSGVSITVGDEALYLPDPSRPGLNEMVPLTAVAEVESVSDDRSGQSKEAVRLGARGFASLGPLGLAASLLAVRKVKDVNFSVRLKDGRSFVATADAVTYANLRAACRAPLVSGDEDAEAAARADAVIAKYIGPEALPLEPTAQPEAPATTAESGPAQVTEAPPREPAPDKALARPVFGRRGVR